MELYLSRELVIVQIHRVRCFAARARSRRKRKNKEKNAQREKLKREIVFSDLRNPPKNFTPLFGEVANVRTLAKKEEQESRDSEEAERCLPQNT